MITYALNVVGKVSNSTPEVVIELESAPGGKHLAFHHERAGDATKDEQRAIKVTGSFANRNSRAAAKRKLKEEEDRTISRSAFRILLEHFLSRGSEFVVDVERRIKDKETSNVGNQLVPSGDQLETTSMDEGDSLDAPPGW